MYQCEYCNYESFSKFNVKRHEAKRHKHKLNQNFQNPGQVHRPWEQQASIQTKTQDKIPSFYQQLDKEHENLKNDFESLFKENKILIQENQHLKNYLNNYNIKH